MIDKIKEKELRRQEVEDLLAKAFSEAGDAGDYSKITCLKGKTDQEKADEMDALIKEKSDLNTEIAKLNKFEQAKQANDDDIAQRKAIRGSAAIIKADEELVDDNTLVKAIRIPAMAKRSKSTTFRSENGVSAEQKAFAFSMAILGGVFKNENARQFCKDHGIQLETKTNVGGLNSAGGFLIPSMFVPDLIFQTEKYGLARQLTTVMPMTSDTLTQPRWTSGMTARPVGETEAGSADDINFSNVALTVKDWMALNEVSSNLREDTAISWADIFMRDAARAFGYAEDNAWINGDATAAYNGIEGIRTKMGSAGIANASGNSWTAITLQDFAGVIAKLPEWADQGDVRWIFSKAFWGSVVQRELSEVGGFTAAEAMAGLLKKEFMGYPVTISQVMPSSSGASQICALLGDTKESTLFGDRQEFEVMIDPYSKSTQRISKLIATERFDINNYSVGDSTNAGAVVCLKTTA